MQNFLSTAQDRETFRWENLSYALDGLANFTAANNCPVCIDFNCVWSRQLLLWLQPTADCALPFFFFLEEAEGQILCGWKTNTWTQKKW